jgi:hypothetical protein
MTDHDRPPGVTVLIAARNAAATLPATLDSLSRQTSPPTEVLVVDDGSTDETGPVAAAAGARVISSPPVGLAAARNLGLAEVATEVVAVVDADDLFSPGHLADGIEAMRSTSADVVAVDAWYWVQGRVAPFTHFDCSRPPAVLTQEALLTGNPLLSTCFVRTEVLRAVGGYDASLAALEDYDLWLRFVERGFRVVPAPHATMWYRREGGMTADASGMYDALENVLTARRVRLGLATETPPPVAVHAAVGAGNWALLAGDPAGARTQWARARAQGDARVSLRLLSIGASVAPRPTAALLRRRLTAAGQPQPAQVAAWWRRDGSRQPAVPRPDLVGLA